MSKKYNEISVECLAEKELQEEFKSMKFNDPIFKKIKQEMKPIFGLHYTCDLSTFQVEWESADAREKCFAYFKENK